MSDAEDRIKEIRKKIDALDSKLLEMVSERAELAKSVARAKESEEASRDYYRPDREAMVLARLCAENPGTLPDHYVRRVFQEVMSVCRALESPMAIGFLGPEGTFTEAAAFKHFGHAVRAVPLATIDSVFREVESGTCDFGVVPVENSTEGVVNHTLDMFQRSTLEICGEVELRIHHNLMASESRSLDEIEHVYSHQQSFAQCRKWLDVNLPQAARGSVSSNAEAARLVLETPNSAAIAGSVAAEVYDLTIIAPNIEDEPDNTTRFLVIGAQSVRATGNDKTSLLFSARNRPGALFELLESFARADVSMTRIESRPSRSGLWEYVFYVDVEGHATDANVSQAIKDLEGHAAFLKVLGSYPRAAR